MKRKRLLLILACLAALLLAGYGTLRLTAPPHHCITEENIDGIQEGMTEKQVEEILGGPAGIYASGGVTGHYSFPPSCMETSGLDLVRATWGKGKEWVAKDISVFVFFDKGSRVRITLKGWSESSDESFLAKLRRWLGM